MAASLLFLQRIFSVRHDYLDEVAHLFDLATKGVTANAAARGVLGLTVRAIHPFEMMNVGGSSYQEAV